MLSNHTTERLNCERIWQAMIAIPLGDYLFVEQRCPSGKSAIGLLDNRYSRFIKSTKLITRNDFIDQTVKGVGQDVTKTREN